MPISLTDLMSNTHDAVNLFTKESRAFNHFLKLTRHSKALKLNPILFIDCAVKPSPILYIVLTFNLFFGSVHKMTARQ